MYKKILKEQLEILQDCQKKVHTEVDTWIHLSFAIQETAEKLQAVTEKPQIIELDGSEIAEALKAILNPEDIEDDEELWEAPSKEEILEDFSNDELIQELEKRGVLEVSKISSGISLILYRTES